jgi:hypothetical protein
MSFVEFCGLMEVVLKPSMVTKMRRETERCWC